LAVLLLRLDLLRLDLLRLDLRRSSGSSRVEFVILKGELARLLLRLLLLMLGQ
jgi:hypothetical protein